MVILFFAVLIVAAAVIFSAQNAATVTLSFITWTFSASLAIVVFLAVLAGMVIMGLLWMGASIRKSVKKGAKIPDVATANKDGAPSKETAKAP
ncbi:MAG: LapA family protein [Syntrophorhabdales bacterium]|jgi:uncharacterized integral membrane protein